MAVIHAPARAHAISARLVHCALEPQGVRCGVRAREELDEASEGHEPEHQPDHRRRRGAQAAAEAQRDGERPEADQHLVETAVAGREDGGDGYAVFADGAGTSREVMADVLLAYIQAAGTVSPLLDGRIDDLAT